MKPATRLIVTALIALCWSGLAAANPDDSSPSVDASALRAVTTIRLDLAFESFVAKDAGTALIGLAGPSAMECSRAATRGGPEVCLVTTNRHGSTSPAALAQR